MGDGQNTNNSQYSEEEMGEKMEKLLKEAEDVNRNLEGINSRVASELTEIEAGVSGSEKKMEGIFSDLDKAEEVAEGELDDLIVRQIMDVSEEDKSEE